MKKHLIFVVATAVLIAVFATPAANAQPNNNSWKGKGASAYWAIGNGTGYIYVAIGEEVLAWSNQAPQRWFYIEGHHDTAGPGKWYLKGYTENVDFDWNMGAKGNITLDLTLTVTYSQLQPNGTLTLRGTRLHRIQVSWITSPTSQKNNDVENGPWKAATAYVWIDHSPTSPSHTFDGSASDWALVYTPTANSKPLSRPTTPFSLFP